ncbi:MAG: type II secretion system F family protein, partial [Planctomycetota bacterium]
TLCLARFTWALQLVLDTPMDLRKALPLALDAAGNPYFSDHRYEVARSIEQGCTLHDALAKTGVLPAELLHSIAVGEEAGSLVETMRRESAEYQDRAATAISVLAQIVGYAVWLGVAALIIFLIFRLASFYIGVINDAASGL